MRLMGVSLHLASSSNDWVFVTFVYADANNLLHSMVHSWKLDDYSLSGGDLIQFLIQIVLPVWHYGHHPPHDDVIKWKHFPRYWPFVRGPHRSPVNSPHKGHWRGALMFSLICAWFNGWVNNREAGDLRHHRAHCDVTVMNIQFLESSYGELIKCSLTPRWHM